MAQSPNVKDVADEVIQDLRHEIKDKIILTTGVSPGSLGATFVEIITRGQPAFLILAGRDRNKLQRTANAIESTGSQVPVRLLLLDLGSLAMVRQSAVELKSWDDVPHIDVLVNSAGIMATDFALSPDGFESQLATNHLGHFLFTNLIMDKILRSKSPRIVNISSDGHRLSPIRWADYNFMNGDTYNKWHAYGQSKTANMLMSVSLAEKLGPKRNVLAFSLHPGVIMTTQLGTHLDWTVDVQSLRAVDTAMGNAEGWADFKVKTPQQGVATYVHAAFDPDLEGHNGVYLQDSRIADPWTDTVKPWATNPIEAERLWRLSEELVGQRFSY
ncbi:MAG: hypothetical protein LQ339_004765 [Xanthoria mediterranea]|nr:MAG: hypothetical protein LQ339_004765 [Xanthoria mediterranea]